MFRRFFCGRLRADLTRGKSNFGEFKFWQIKSVRVLDIWTNYLFIPKNRRRKLCFLTKSAVKLN